MNSAFRVVDGGCLKWTFGSSDGRREGWKSDHRPYYTLKWGNTIIIMDGATNKREQYTDTYKARRHDKRNMDEEWAKKVDGVAEFMNTDLLTDPSLEIVRFDGLEADDVIAFLGYYIRTYHPDYGPLRVTGVDKDYLQLPKDMIQLRRIDNTRVKFTAFREKLPRGIQHVIKKRHHVLLYLCLYGDKSDSIPRLIPNYDGRTFCRILQSRDPYGAAFTRFGDEFLRNLYLAALPGPWCYIVPPDEATFFELVRNGIHPDLRMMRGDLLVACHKIMKHALQLPEETKAPWL